MVPKPVRTGAVFPHRCSMECSILLSLFFSPSFLCTLMLSLYLTSSFLLFFFLKLYINILWIVALLIYLKAFVQLKASICSVRTLADCYASKALRGSWKVLLNSAKQNNNKKATANLKQC